MKPDLKDCTGPSQLEELCGGLIHCIIRQITIDNPGKKVKPAILSPTDSYDVIV